MKDYIENLTKYYDNELNEIIGNINFDLIAEKDGEEISRLEESSLGNLITDALRNIGGANISFICGRNIKNDLKKGNIIYKNIINLLPFYDEVIVKEVKGQDILDALEYGVRLLPKKSPKFLQFLELVLKLILLLEAQLKLMNMIGFVELKEIEEFMI